MSVSVLIKHSCPSIGEGPHWEEKTKSLLYVDIECGEVHRFNTVTGRDASITLDDEVGHIIPRASGGYMVGVGRNLAALDWDTKTVTPLAEVDRGKGKTTRVNDAKCDPSGRLWAGTMGTELKDGQFVPEMGSLYSLETNHSLKKQYSPVTISNGLAWSSDNSTMFYVDSGPRSIYAFNFDLQEGNISNKRVVADFSDQPIIGFGSPDGMCIDTDGKLWVACFFGAGVIQVDPETGKVLRKVDIPAGRVTSCCFGGPNYDELFVTSSWQSTSWPVTDSEKASHPMGGSVFKITGLGAKGLPAYEYQG